MASRVLIVDDDQDILDAVAETLEECGYDTKRCSSAFEALKVLEDKTFDVVVTDVRMPTMDGIELCARIATNHDIPVIVMTAFGDLSAATDALRASAFDFITKPFETMELAQAVERALTRGAASRVHFLHSPAPDLDFSEIVGSSPAVRRLTTHLARICETDASVLVTGESGTGKELIARALHRNSPRAKGPFVAVSCAAVPAPLLESELFGHEKGAFTGAHDARRGLFVQANGGTLFLDEIGAMPVALQPALLRTLQERVVRSVGGGREQPFDVRIIAATNEDLERSVVAGTFRDSLLFRLNVLQVHAPPLRERGEDVLVLARTFLARKAGSREARSDGTPLHLSDASAELLLRYPWPGNVRELQNSMAAAAVLCQGPLVEPSDLSPEIRKFVGPREPDERHTASLEHLRRAQIEQVLRAVGGNKAEAARVLGIDRVTLYRRIKRLGPDDSAR